MRQNLYSIFSVEISDKGFYFKKSEDSEELYITVNGRPKQDDWLAKSVLSLGASDLYVVHWEKPNGKTATWFLNKQLKMIANKNLLLDSDLKNTHYSKLWSAYLNDIVYRVWYTLITPGLIHTHPDFSPSQLFISNAVSEDFKYILYSITGECSFIDYSEALKLYPTIEKEYIHKGFTSNLTYSDNWQDIAVATGYVKFPSPFSGELIKSCESVLLHNSNVAYRFQTDSEVFFLIVHSHFSQKIALYFPARRIFVYQKGALTSNLDTMQKFLSAFLFKVLEDWCLLKDYFRKTESKLSILTYETEHIGHNIWDELASFERMEKHNVLHKVEKMYVYPGSEVFAPIDELFADLQGKISRINNLNALISSVYKNNQFFIKKGASLITESLASKIINYSVLNQKNLSDNFKSFSKKDFDIVILFTLRFGNRSWLEQEEGICKVISRLSKNYSKKIALIVDGHNTYQDAKRMHSHAEGLIKEHTGIDLFDQEYQTSERIKSNLAEVGVHVINTIGCTVKESINWCLTCDFFIAPWGAGLAKYKWVTNSRGLVFSNRKILTSHHRSFYDDTKIREGAICSEYIDLSAIEDIAIKDVAAIENFVKNDPNHRENFKVSIDALYEKVKEMTEKYGRVEKTLIIVSNNL